MTTALPVASTARLRNVLQSAFWLLPALCVTASIGLAIGLITLDSYLPAAHGVLLYPGPPSGARSFLSSIVQAMISFTALVFSITIVVLQLTSGQFSPRVLRMFLRDRTSQLALGLFIATFVYAMVVQRAVRGSTGHDAVVPRIAVTVAFVFVLASVGLFIRYIGYVANMIRVATIIDAIAAESRALLEHRYPADLPEPGPARLLPPPVCTEPAPRPGVILSVNERVIAHLAANAGCVLVMTPRIGDFVPAGAPLFTVHAEHRGADVDLPGLRRRLHNEIAIDTERTMEQDLAFGFRQLIDIAERALSPAVNDPTTACQVLDALRDLLRRLGTRHLPAGDVTGPDNQVRLRVPQYQFTDFLTLVITEIWRYGSGAAQVPGRIATMLTDLAAAALPAHCPAIRHWMRELGTAPE